MRGIGQHQPPAVMQPCPADNTDRHVAAQVQTWQRDQVVVHTEVAREIAAWWQTPARSDAFQGFAGAGLILAGLPDAIDSALRAEERNGCGDPVVQHSLAALAAYVAACPGVTEIHQLQELIDDVEAAADGDSNDDEIGALHSALDVALTRWPEIPDR